MNKESPGLRVYSIFKSIQGESSLAGYPCVFIRLSGCSVGCNYCDTKEAQQIEMGTLMTVSEILKIVKSKKTELVEVTGGEPLFQKGTLELLKSLCDNGYNVMLETSGAYSIELVDSRVLVVMDVKTPGSGAWEKMLPQNIGHIGNRRGEAKFVITSQDDFDWAVDFVKRNNMLDNTAVSFSSGCSDVKPFMLAEWVRDCGLNIKFQLQLHKVLWPKGETEL